MCDTIARLTATIAQARQDLAPVMAELADVIVLCADFRAAHYDALPDENAHRGLDQVTGHRALMDAAWALLELVDFQAVDTQASVDAYTRHGLFERLEHRKEHGKEHR